MTAAAGDGRAAFLFSNYSDVVPQSTGGDGCGCGTELALLLKYGDVGGMSSRSGAAADD